MILLVENLLNTIENVIGIFPSQVNENSFFKRNKPLSSQNLTSNTQVLAVIGRIEIGSL